MKINRKLIAIVVTFILIAALVPLEIVFFNLDKQALAIQKQWSTAYSIVTTSHTEYDRTEVFGDIYKVHVVYEYQVQGVTYHNDLTREADSPNMNYGFPLGKRIVVHYDPSKPSRSYIMSSPSNWVIPLILTPLIIPIGCVVIWAWATSKWIWSSSGHKRNLLKQIFHILKEISRFRVEK